MLILILVLLLLLLLFMLLLLLLLLLLPLLTPFSTTSFPSMLFGETLLPFSFMLGRSPSIVLQYLCCLSPLYFFLCVHTEDEMRDERVGEGERKESCPYWSSKKDVSRLIKEYLIFFVVPLFLSFSLFWFLFSFCPKPLHSLF